MRLSSVCGTTQETAKKPHRYNKQQVPQSIEIQCSKGKQQKSRHRYNKYNNTHHCCCCRSWNPTPPRTLGSPPPRLSTSPHDHSRSTSFPCTRPTRLWDSLDWATIDSSLLRWTTKFCNQTTSNNQTIQQSKPSNNQTTKQPNHQTIRTPIRQYTNTNPTTPNNRSDVHQNAHRRMARPSAWSASRVTLSVGTSSFLQFSAI